MARRLRAWWVVALVIGALAVTVAGRTVTEAASSTAQVDPCPTARPLLPQASGILQSFEAGRASGQATAVGLKSIEARLRVLARQSDDDQRERIQDLTDALAAARSAIATDADSRPEVVAVLKDALAVAGRVCPG